MNSITSLCIVIFFAKKDREREEKSGHKDKKVEQMIDLKGTTITNTISRFSAMYLVGLYQQFRLISKKV